jgi:hypothetical protein
MEHSIPKHALYVRFPVYNYIAYFVIWKFLDFVSKTKKTVRYILEPREAICLTERAVKNETQTVVVVREEEWGEGIAGALKTSVGSHMRNNSQLSVSRTPIVTVIFLVTYLCVT